MTYMKIKSQSDKLLLYISLYETYLISAPRWMSQIATKLTCWTVSTKGNRNIIEIQCVYMYIEKLGRIVQTVDDRWMQWSIDHTTNLRILCDIFYKVLPAFYLIEFANFPQARPCQATPPHSPLLSHSPPGIIKLLSDMALAFSMFRDVAANGRNRAKK